MMSWKPFDVDSSEVEALGRKLYLTWFESQGVEYPFYWSELTDEDKARFCNGALEGLMWVFDSVWDPADEPEKS